MRIFLIGYMGCGKSSIGSKLAERLSTNFHDTDIMIEKRFGGSIAEIFRNKGESGFRIKEREVLKDIFAVQHGIVATGGGLPCYDNNIERLNLSGVSIYLKCSSQVLAKRIFPERENRPLISGYTTLDELNKFVAKHLLEREKFYFHADYIINADGHEDDVVQSVLDVLSDTPT